jgi:glutathione-regulated potassium-efflux system ancillary protein KefF
MSRDIYLVAAHPNWRESRVNARFYACARQLERVDWIDLYGEYPDYSIDVRREQARLSQAKLLVLLHPIYWYAMPALLKLWIDEVLTYGWAYGTGGDALRGKDFWLVASTGGAADSYRGDGYNNFDFEQFLPPYIQTARLCGMRFLPPMIIHGAHQISSEEFDRYAERFDQKMRNYPNWCESEPAHSAAVADVPAIDRVAQPQLDGQSATDSRAGAQLPASSST